jgi:hypothetical protein
MSFSIKAVGCEALLGAIGLLAAGAPVTQDAPKKPVGSADVKDEYRILADIFSAGSDYRTVVDAFRTAQDGPDKETKKAELKKKLTEVFEADMKARKAQAEEIEKRLNKLQEQYKAREAAKERIIDLQIEVLDKDAEGLGFPKGGGEAEANHFGGGSRNRVDPRNDATSLIEKSVSNRGATIQTRPLEVIKLRSPELVHELKKKGLFVVSDDQSTFAVVEGNYPNGPWTVLLLDSASGKLLAKYEPDSAVAEIRFQEGGVGVRTEEGKFEVRIPLGAAPVDSRPVPSQEKPDFVDNSPANANRLATDNVGGGELNEYRQLRLQYLQSKIKVENADIDVKSLMAPLKEQNKTFDEGEFSKKYKLSMESQFRQWTTILETKLKLLAFDVQSSKASFVSNEAEFAKAQLINNSKPNAVSELELRRLQAQMDNCRIELMRAETIYDLFQSIEAEGKSKPEATRR